MAQGFTKDTIATGTTSIWSAAGPTSLIVVPPTTGWTWDNQSSATVTSTPYSTEQLAIASGLGTGLHLRYRTAPTPPYTITALFHVNAMTAISFLRFGLNFRQSSDGKIAGLHIRTESGHIVSTKYTNSTTFSADYTAFTTSSGRVSNTLMWLRIKDDNTNRIVSFSWDGINFIQLHSVGRTDFLTADQVGFHIQTEGGSDMFTHLVSWLEG